MLLAAMLPHVQPSTPPRCPQISVSSPAIMPERPGTVAVDEITSSLMKDTLAYR